jgi:hypothetical protein
MGHAPQLAWRGGQQSTELQWEAIVVRFKGPDKTSRCRRAIVADELLERESVTAITTIAIAIAKRLQVDGLHEE